MPQEARGQRETVMWEGKGEYMEEGGEDAQDPKERESVVCTLL